MPVPLLHAPALAPHDWPLLRAASLGDPLRARVDQVALRAPPLDDAPRWQHVLLDGRPRRIAHPVTLTPYASRRPCSARCGFCSENLRVSDAGRAAAQLRPRDDYFDGLAAMLRALRGITLSWSLSGLESTDDGRWLRRVLEVLTEAERDAVTVEQRVLYSNGAGLARADGVDLADALARFGLSWIELSRHHPDAARNHGLMRFRDGEAVREADAFARAVQVCAARFPVRLVCLVQRGGVDTPEAMLAYLAWARALGAQAVVFRELSRLSPQHLPNATARHIERSRVPVDALAAALFARAGTAGELQPLRLTEGYYFWNLVARWRDALEVTFECADYAVMQQRHASDRVYKLVYFASGELCGGWQPGQQVLWRHAHG